jgi:hypothetical protein
MQREKCWREIDALDDLKYQAKDQLRLELKRMEQVKDDLKSGAMPPKRGSSGSGGSGEISKNWPSETDQQDRAKKKAKIHLQHK